MFGMCYEFILQVCCSTAPQKQQSHTIIEFCIHGAKARSSGCVVARIAMVGTPAVYWRPPNPYDRIHFCTNGLAAPRAIPVHVVDATHASPMAQTGHTTQTPKQRPRARLSFTTQACAKTPHLRSQAATTHASWCCVLISAPGNT